MVDHDVLIDALCNDAPPVRRVPPPWRRALVWAPLALAAGYGATSFVHRTPTDWTGPLAGIAAANVALSLMLGLMAFAAALSAGVAGRSLQAGGWAVAALVTWMALTAYSIGISSHPAGHLGHGTFCFVFVLIAGVPMIAVALMALRRTRSLHPVRSLTLAGAAITYLSFGLLALCHPVAMSVVDLAGHLAAGLCLGGMTVLLGRRAIAA